MDEIKVMLVEDHMLVREGTKQLLSRAKDILVVAEAGDGEEAVALARTHLPDVILMDIAMPEMDGLEATRRIKAQNPRIAVLVLSAYDDDEYVFAILEAGAAGYLLKDVSADDLIKAVRAVHVGESVLHTVIARKVTDYFARSGESGKGEPVDLTEREVEVLKLAARGLRNRDIAEELTLSIRTVQVHMSNIFAKLKVGSRTEAVLCALRQGVISLQDTV